jgi:hypothetical protein
MILSAAGFVLALLSREYRGVDIEGRFRLIMWPKLLKFPGFWCGALLLSYVAVQGMNPAWTYVTDGHYWWLARNRDFSWLPHAISAPFVKFNLWRQAVIYSDSWMLVCAIWVGLTNRKSLRLILGALALNALCLGIVLFVQQATGVFSVPWAPPIWAAQGLTGPFIYKNHAGAYFGLMVFVAFAMGSWALEHGIVTSRRSTPAGLWAIIGLVLSGAVAFTLSRGATLILGSGLLIFFMWFFFWQRYLPKRAAPDFRLKMLSGILALATIGIAVKYTDFTRISAHFVELTRSQDYRANISVGGRIMARAAAVDMLAANGKLGVGAGCFRYLFPVYLRSYPEIYHNGALFWQHAHCDWLEFPIECGIFGDAIALLGACWIIRSFFGSKAWRSPIAAPISIGVLLTLVHAGFDFPFQCPAILATWASLLFIAKKWMELTPAESMRASKV